MQYRTLGRGLTVSAIGIGCMGMSHAYGAPADRKEMTELLAQAVDMSCTFFDSAEVYGTADNSHDNEELVGAALKLWRDQIVLATKFGIHFDSTSNQVNKPLIPDSRPEVIRASVEASLKRLGTDHIDLYYQHRADPNVPVEEVAYVHRCFCILFAHQRRDRRNPRVAVFLTIHLREEFHIDSGNLSEIIVRGFGLSHRTEGKERDAAENQRKNAFVHGSTSSLCG